MEHGWRKLGGFTLIFYLGNLNVFGWNTDDADLYDK